MNDVTTLHGIILSSEPIGEADRRLVILTGEQGRITAFVRGARRPNSPFVASSLAFVFGEFLIYEGRNSNSINDIFAKNYFDKIKSDVESSCYAGYFAELSNYYSHEGLEAKDMVNLLYATLSALEKKQIPNDLIKSVFELKLMTINGEYSDVPMTGSEGAAISDAAAYAWQFVITSPIKSLYSFTLSKEIKEEFSGYVDNLKKYYIECEFKSLDILNTLIG